MCTKKDLQNWDSAQNEIVNLTKNSEPVNILAYCIFTKMENFLPMLHAEL